MIPLQVRKKNVKLRVIFVGYLFNKKKAEKNFYNVSVKKSVFGQNVPFQEFKLLKSVLSAWWGETYISNSFFYEAVGKKASENPDVSIIEYPIVIGKCVVF